MYGKFDSGENVCDHMSVLRPLDVPHQGDGGSSTHDAAGIYQSVKNVKPCCWLIQPRAGSGNIVLAETTPRNDSDYHALAQATHSMLAQTTLTGSTAGHQVQLQFVAARHLQYTDIDDGSL